MIRVCVRASIVSAGKLLLDVNWYDTDTLEQNGFSTIYEDAGGSEGMLYTAMAEYVTSSIPNAVAEDVIWL